MPTVAHDALRVLERISDAYIVLDHEYRFVYANPVAERDMKKSLAELRGRVHWEVFPASYDITAGRSYRAAVETNEPQFFVEHYHYEGFDIHMEMQAYPTDDGGVAVFWRDVTERVTGAAALAESEERYAMAARATRNAIWDWELETGRITWNNGLTAQFGHPRDTTTSHADWWTAAIHPDDREAVNTSLQALFTNSSGGDVWQATYRFRRHDGTYAEVFDRGCVNRDAMGRAVRMIGAMEDVTEQHHLEAQLRQAQKMEAIGLLAGGIAHDFNNLLTVINGNLEFVRSTLRPTQELQQELDEIAMAAERARVLVRQLLTFSRKESAQPRDVDVGELLTGTEQLLRRLIGEEIAFQIHIHSDTPSVRIDAGQLEQVVMNLVVNARDAMTADGRERTNGGTLIVESSATLVSAKAEGERTALPPGTYLQLVVQDTGYGMDEMTRSHIFEPFFTTKAVGAGTGLGLATVHGIVLQAGGAILVESEAGRGSTFTVLLPAAETVQKQSPAIRSPNHSVSATILLVEDEASLRAVMRRALERSGHAVLEARHGNDALMLWQEHRGKVDIVVTDVRMPELGGNELVKRIRRDEPTLPVVFVSGYTDLGLATMLGSHDRFLGKPFTFGELMSVIGDLLRARDGR